MMNDVVLNKKLSIERCVLQARTYYQMDRSLDFKEDLMKQDAIAINLQRACEQAIDLANYTIKRKKLGLPQQSKESFSILATNGIIDRKLSENMQKMVGFRNVLVHEYQKLDLDLMINIVETHIDDIVTFSNMIVKAFDNQS